MTDWSAGKVDGRLTRRSTLSTAAVPLYRTVSGHCGTFLWSRDQDDWVHSVRERTLMVMDGTFIAVEVHSTVVQPLGQSHVHISILSFLVLATNSK